MQVKYPIRKPNDPGFYRARNTIEGVYLGDRQFVAYEQPHGQSIPSFSVNYTQGDNADLKDDYKATHHPLVTELLGFLEPYEAFWRNPDFLRPGLPGKLPEVKYPVSKPGRPTERV